MTLQTYIIYTYLCLALQLEYYVDSQRCYAKENIRMK